MNALIKSPIILLCLAAGLLMGLHQLVTNTNQRLSSLNIIGMADGQSLPPSNIEALKKLYPITSQNKLQDPVPASGSEVISVDDAFLPQEKIAEVGPELKKPEIPDYFNLLKEKNVLSLEAISDEGAIINNRFYAFNAVIEEYAYPGVNGKNVAPRLHKSKKNNQVIIQEANGRRQFVLAQ